MKIKILIVPSLIVAIIALAIWVVIPSYQDMAANKDVLKSAENKLAEIKKKNAQADQLASEINSDSERRDTLMKYVPSSEQEEELINSLNSLANGEGLVVFNFLVTPEQKNSAAASGAVNNNPAAQAIPADGEVAAVQKPTPIDVKIDIGVIGGYDKIRNFIFKASKLKRFNDIVSLKIGKTPSTKNANGETVASDNLQADVVLRFNYFEKKNLATANADNSVFSGGKFDMSVIEDIKKKVDMDMSAVTIESAGKNNPFLP